MTSFPGRKVENDFSSTDAFPVVLTGSPVQADVEAHVAAVSRLEPAGAANWWAPRWAKRVHDRIGLDETGPRPPIERCTRRRPRGPG